MALPDRNWAQRRADKFHKDEQDRKEREKEEKRAKIREMWPNVEARLGELIARSAEEGKYECTFSFGWVLPLDAASDCQRLWELIQDKLKDTGYACHSLSLSHYHHINGVRIAWH